MNSGECCSQQGGLTGRANGVAGRRKTLSSWRDSEGGDIGLGGWLGTGRDWVLHAKAAAGSWYGSRSVPPMPWLTPHPCHPTAVAACQTTALPHPILRCEGARIATRSGRAQRCHRPPGRRGSPGTGVATASPARPEAQSNPSFINAERSPTGPLGSATSRW